MRGADAEAVAAWRYEGEYAFYDADADEEDLAELLDPASWGTKYYAVDDEDLVGFLAFDVRDDATGIGLGLRPDLTGQGLGEELVAAGLRFAAERFGSRAFTLTVAAFNERAQRVYERVGFREVARYEQPANGGLHPFVRMARDPVRMEELTSPEIGVLAATHRVVFACGATEQHGPHLPLAVDALIGDALAERVARKLGDTLMAPTLRVGCSAHHMAFPGSFTLREETFRAVVGDHVESLRAHGFERIAIIPSHGGNFAPLADLAPSLGVAAYTDLAGMIEAWEEIVVASGGPAGHVGGHADIAESSMILALRPELVRTGLAAPGYTGDPAAVLDTIFESGFKAVTENGVLGDPAGMSARLGRALLDAMATRIAASLKAAW